jgi:pimeloyl-ACP methyl ester carboxylesterase
MKRSVWGVLALFLGFGLLRGAEAMAIEKLGKVALNGVDTWILVQSSTNLDAANTKPLLLVLHGGPGFAMMGTLARTNPALLDRFLIVDWDQRGAGRSYDPVEDLDMRFDTIVDDAHKLVQYLTDTYERKQVYLLGHSFGTMIGMMLASRYPDQVAAFVGVGFAVDVVENERGSHSWALERARSSGYDVAVEELEAVGDPGDDVDYPDYKEPVTHEGEKLPGSEVTMYWIGRFGGDVWGKEGSEEIEAEIMDSAWYKDSHWAEGVKYSQQIFDQSSKASMDLSKRVASVSVPVYFFQGAHDADTPYALARDYLDKLKTTGRGSKKLVTFSNSSHFPFVEEPARFTQELIKILP